VPFSPVLTFSQSTVQRTWCSRQSKPLRTWDLPVAVTLNSLRTMRMSDSAGASSAGFWPASAWAASRSSTYLSIDVTV